MISQPRAEALRDAGLRWTPAPGDRFAIPKPGLAGQVFTLSEMTIEAREYPTGTVLGFNGTTEWALDSVAKEEALWLPREDQLRELLGRAFASLRREEGDGREPSHTVSTRGPGGEREFTAGIAEDAYADALLALIAHAMQDTQA